MTTDDAQSNLGHWSIMSRQGQSDAFLNTPSSSKRRTSSNGEDSPGSSVFDLPVYHEVSQTPTLEKRPQPFFGVDGRLSGTPAAIELKERKEDVVLNQSSCSYLVISGGSGGNSICSAFSDVCFVLPVSDDGGSSSEIIRVLGGPSIGESFIVMLFLAH